MGRNAGFTLVEIVLSLVILGTALVALAGAFQLALDGTLVAQDRLTALLLAQQKLEELQRYDFADLSSVSTTPFGDPYSKYTYAVEVSSLSPRLKKVSVSITWSDALGHLAAETLSSQVPDWD